MDAREKAKVIRILHNVRERWVDQGSAFTALTDEPSGIQYNSVGLHSFMGPQSVFALALRRWDVPRVCTPRDVQFPVCLLEAESRPMDASSVRRRFTMVSALSPASCKAWSLAEASLSRLPNFSKS